MKSLETKLGRVILRNPVLGASGCCGHGYELSDYVDLSRYGGLSLKTFTAEPRMGNRPERIAEVPSGILNSIGLQNPGKKVFFSEVMPKVLSVLDSNQIIVSVGGNAVEDYAALCVEVEKRFGHQIAAVELNAACPNVNHGAGFYSRDPKAAYELVHTVRNTVDMPVFVKLNTNFPNYLEVAAAMEEAGADALYTTNTPMGMKVNIKSRKPAIGNGRGPVCGAAIRPIGVLRTWDLYQAVKIPIIASGGICRWEDALEYIMAGATAVGVGSIHFSVPNAAELILNGIEQYLERENITFVSDLIGIAHQ